MAKTKKTTKQDWLSFTDDTIEAAERGIVRYYLETYGDFYEALEEMVTSVNEAITKEDGGNINRDELILRANLDEAIANLNKAFGPTGYEE